jgi:hypothetical protein
MSQTPPIQGGTAGQTGATDVNQVKAQSEKAQADALAMQAINLQSQAFYANLQAAKGITDRADQFFKSVSDTIGRA